MPALILYLITLPTDLTWAHHSGDGGDLIAAAVSWGIPHPPGYPTYILLGKAISLLPIGVVAFRFHLFSACCMAASAGILATISIPNHGSFIATRIAAALTFAAAPLVWGQATVAEVYALNALGFALFLQAAWRPSPPNPIILGALFAFSVTTHLTSMALLPILIAACPPKDWGKAVLGGLLGSAPWLALPALGALDSPVKWEDPTTLSGWIHLASGALYRPNVLGLPASAWRERAVSWLPAFLAQFGYVGWGLWLAGMWENRRQLNRHLVAALTSVWLYGIYAFGYAAQDASVTFLPAIALLSVLLRFGLRPLKNWAILLPLFLVGINFVGFYQSKGETIGDEARQLMQGMPANAIGVTSGDDVIFAMWYVQHAEKSRQDVILVDENLFAFDWYRRHLSKQYPHLIRLEKDELDMFLRDNNHPICRIQPKLQGMDCASAAP